MFTETCGDCAEKSGGKLHSVFLSFYIYRMIRILLLMTLCLGSSFFLSAQDKTRKTPEEKARRKTTEMVTTLKLNKEQENMLYATNLKAYQSIATYEAKNTSKKLRKKQKDIVQGLREKEFQKILTQAQFTEYRRLEAEENKREVAEKAAKKKQEEAEKKKKAVEKKKGKDEADVLGD